MIRGIIGYVRGWAQVEVVSASCERLLDQCRLRGIRLWRVRRTAPDRVTAYMPSGRLEEVMDMGQRCMCDIYVLRRSGLLNSVRPFASRRLLLAAALICAALCRLSTCFLWQITISGCETVSPRGLLLELRSLGLETGRPISSIDTDVIKLGIMMRRDDIAYMTINIKGTRAQVEIRERREAIPHEDDTPCDIVSDRAGVIKSIKVFEGEQLAHQGDTVDAGDILVSGKMVSSQGEVRYVRAMADVTLRTWRDITAALPGEIYGREYTGRRRVRLSVEVGGHVLGGCCIEKVPFAWYDKTKEYISADSGGTVWLPVRIIKETYAEYEPKRLELSAGKCSQVLESTCRGVLDLVTNGGVKSADFGFTFEDGVIRGRMTAECEESAGIRSPAEQTGE